MAIDSIQKRASVAGISGPYMFGIRPDATKPQAWRQTAGWGYYGNLVGVPPEVVAVVRGYAQILHFRRAGILR